MQLWLKNNLRVVYTEKEDGNMKKEANREKLRQRLALNRIYSPTLQKHTTTIVKAGQQREGDGIYTQEKRVGVGVITADCLPLVISDGKMVMTLHVGWRGLFRGIVEKGLAKFSQPERIIAFMGPSIGNCCYQVGEDFRQLARESQGEKFIQRRGSKLYFDLAGMVRYKLVKAKVKEDNIEEVTRCTYDDKKLFSYRRGDRYKLLLTIGWLDW